MVLVVVHASGVAAGRLVTRPFLQPAVDHLREVVDETDAAIGHVTRRCTQLGRHGDPLDVVAGTVASSRVVVLERISSFRQLDALSRLHSLLFPVDLTY